MWPGGAVPGPGCPALPRLTCLYLYRSSKSSSSSKAMMDMQATSTGVKRGSSGGCMLASGRGWGRGVSGGGGLWDPLSPPGIGLCTA